MTTKPSYTLVFDSIANCSIAELDDRRYSKCAKTKEYPFLPLGNRLYIRRVRKRKITRPVCFAKQNKNSSSSMISSIRHKQSISWTFSNDSMAISAKEMPKNHTDKERFAAALSCILTLLFPRKRRRSSPSLFISHRFLGAVVSRILKSLIPSWHAKCSLPVAVRVSKTCLRKLFIVKI